MLSVIVDCNIFVSSLLGSSNASAVVNALMARQIKLITSKVLLAEIIKTVQGPKLNKLIVKEDLAAIVFFIELRAKFVNPSWKIDLCRDPKDNALLEAAFESQADMIVTGDKDLLVLNPFRNIAIITPAEFLKRLGRS